MSFRKLAFTILAIGLGAGAMAQDVKRSPAGSPQSVVVLPPGQRPQIDTAALILPEPASKKQRHKIGIRIVPAPPPGRSRQEILYSDSLAKIAPEP